MFRSAVDVTEVFCWCHYTERTVTIFRQLFDTRKTFRVLCAISKTCCSESTVKLSFAPRCHTICTAYSNLHLKVFKIIAVTLVNQPLLYSFIYFLKKLSNFLKQLVTVSLSKHHLNWGKWFICWGIFQNQVYCQSIHIQRIALGVLVHIKYEKTCEKYCKTLRNINGCSRQNNSHWHPLPDHSQTDVYF